MRCRDVRRCLKGRVVVFGGGFLIGVLGSCLVSKLQSKLREEYERDCLYMAVMDDEICRNELAGMRINGREVEFPPRSESLHYRLELWRELNKDLSKKQRQKEIEEMQERLALSRDK
ncbi:MAG: hypothetical protein Q3993_01355 [Filifactor alocis]|nr:hypothetical protein [Filifactor alocis]